MTTFLPSANYPATIEYNAHARNGRPTSGTLARKTVEALNHVVAYRRKGVLNFTRQLSDIPAGVSGTAVWWQGYMRTGLGVKELVFHHGFARTDSASAADPRINWTVNAGTTDTLHTNNIDTGAADVPGEFAWSSIRYAVSPDTVYTLSLNVIDYCRPFCCQVYEVATVPVDDSVNGAVNPNMLPGSQIVSTHVNDLLQQGTNLWKKNATHLMSWTRPGAAGTAPSITSATYVNIFDGSAGTPTATTTQGFRVVTVAHNTEAKTTVPVVIAVMATRSGASTNAVRVISSAGSTIATFNDYTTEAWQTVTTTLPAGTTKFDIQAKVDGGDTLTVSAISIYEYQ